MTPHKRELVCIAAYSLGADYATVSAEVMRTRFQEISAIKPIPPRTLYRKLREHGGNMSSFRQIENADRQRILDAFAAADLETAMAMIDLYDDEFDPDTMQAINAMLQEFGQTFYEHCVRANFLEGKGETLERALEMPSVGQIIEAMEAAPVTLPGGELGRRIWAGGAWTVVSA